LSNFAYFCPIFTKILTFFTYFCLISPIFPLFLPFLPPLHLFLPYLCLISPIFAHFCPFSNHFCLFSPIFALFLPYLCLIAPKFALFSPYFCLFCLILPYFCPIFAYFTLYFSPISPPGLVPFTLLLLESVSGPREPLLVLAGVHGMAVGGCALAGVWWVAGWQWLGGSGTVG
jgi:hypothetical protein